MAGCGRGDALVGDDAVRNQGLQLGGENLLFDARQAAAEFREGVRSEGKQEQDAHFPFAGDDVEHQFNGAGIERIAFVPVGAAGARGGHKFLCLGGGFHGNHNGSGEESKQWQEQ